MAQEINEQEHIAPGAPPEPAKRRLPTAERKPEPTRTQGQTPEAPHPAPARKTAKPPRKNPEPSAAPAEAQRVMPHGSPPFLRRKALPMLRLRKRQSPLRKLPEQI